MLLREVFMKKMFEDRKWLLLILAIVLVVALVIGIVVVTSGSEDPANVATSDEAQPIETEETGETDDEEGEDSYFPPASEVTEETESTEAIIVGPTESYEPEVPDVTEVNGSGVVEDEPTEAPTEAPTEEPTEPPTEVPTEKPTEAPDDEPEETKPKETKPKETEPVETEPVETEPATTVKEYDFGGYDPTNITAKVFSSWDEETGQAFIDTYSPIIDSYDLDARFRYSCVVYAGTDPYSMGKNGIWAAYEDGYNYILTSVCPYCGETMCEDSVYQDDRWGDTLIDHDRCSEYDIKKDSRYYCQDCGLPLAHYAEVGEMCCYRSTFGKGICPNCEEYYGNLTCHSCEKV